MDERLLRAIYGGGAAGPLTFVMIALTTVGSGWILAPVVPMVALRRTRALAVALLAVVAVQEIAVVLLKLAVGRVRPWRALGLHALVALPTDPSFPSGHAAGSFAVATFLALVLAPRAGSRARALALAVALVSVAAAIALSRVYLGAHWPSDVAAGAALGSLIGALGARAYAKLALRGGEAPTL